MKITIDTNQKQISIDQNVTIDELIRELEKLFSGGEWRQFTLLATVYYSYPYYPTYPSYPTYQTVPWTL